VEIETAVAALTVRVVETFALVAAVATADGSSNGGQNRIATKVLCNIEGGGNGGKSDGGKGGGQAMATATIWVMATETRLAGDKEGKCKDGKGNGNGNEGRWWRQQWLKQGQRWQWRQQWLWQWQTTSETAGAGKNQQNAAGSSNSGGYSGCASREHCSVAATASRGSGTVEVTTMRAAQQQ
jgi:hypothetical protein